MIGSGTFEKFDILRSLIKVTSSSVFNGPMLSVNSIIDKTGFKAVCCQFDQESFKKVAHFVEITKIAIMVIFWSGCLHETSSCNKEERILKRFEQSWILLILLHGLWWLVASYDLNLVQRPKRYCLSKPAVGPPHTKTRESLLIPNCSNKNFLILADDGH